MYEEFKKKYFQKSINVRDAIYGGRTEVFKSFHEIKQGEKIRYLDFTSLYPYVNKYGPYPIGHPKIYRNIKCTPNNLKNVRYVNGLIKCKILPPNNLLIPVLPYRCNSKLIFGLCKTCMDTENVVKKCSHNIDEKSIIGTWVSCEIKLALEKGYKLMELFEVWDYDIEQYNSTDGVTLFFLYRRITLSY